MARQTVNAQATPVQARKVLVVHFIAPILIIAFFTVSGAWAGAWYARRRYTSFLAARLAEERDATLTATLRVVTPNICRRCAVNVTRALNRRGRKHPAHATRQ